MFIYRFILLLSASTTIITISGCASVDVRRVTDDDQTGIRYWRPAPYFALAPSTSGKQTVCQATLVMLPDKTEEYAINAHAGAWGSAEADPTLQDGWNLTSMTGKADSKTAETLTAFSSVLKALPLEATKAGPKKGGEPGAEVTEKCSGLIRVDYDPMTHELTGFTKMRLPVEFAFSPAPKPSPTPKKDSAKPEPGAKTE